LALWGLVSTCSSQQPPPEAPAQCNLQIISAAIIASPFINPSPAGEPRPTQVRLYQLKSDTRFQNASFEEIWKTDADVLKDDLVKVDELPVYPNSRTQLKFERDESAQFLIAAALFRTPKGKSWFTSFEYPPAPSEGSCGAPAPAPDPATCPDGQCADGGAEGPISNPRFYIWLDDTRIEDGSEHAEDYPEGRVSTVPLSGKPSGDSPGPKPPSGVPEVPGKPELPQKPDVPKPNVPSAPEVPDPSQQVPKASPPSDEKSMMRELL
jgi:type VI secretion system VasD/TssJ family lipoprotein